jgi:uncharacterized protein YxjI
MSHSTPVPTWADLNVAHPPPAKLLHCDVPADKFYHLVMKEKLWKSWSGDSYGIKYLDNKGDFEKPKEGRPFEVDIKGVALSLRDRMIVQDSHGTPIAIIIGLFLTLETTYKIYTFTPNLERQAPSANQKHQGHALYEYATVKDKMFSVRKNMETVTGDNYVMDGVGSVFAMRRQMRITRNGKTCLHALEKNLGIFKGNQWELRIAPGNDPILLIAYMAVIDEMNEDK